MRRCPTLLGQEAGRVLPIPRAGLNDVLLVRPAGPFSFSRRGMSEATALRKVFVGNRDRYAAAEPRGRIFHATYGRARNRSAAHFLS